MKIVIIGNSAAGTGALEAIRKHDRDSSITIVSDETYHLYSRCLLSYYLAGSIDESALSFRAEDFHRAIDAELVLGKRVTAVDPVKQQVICDDNGKLEYDKLLIATGGSPKVPDNISTDLNGVFVLRSFVDATAIQQHIQPDGNAVILGGGLVGMKTAFALNQRGMKVTVAVRSPHVLSQMIDYDGAQIVTERLRENDIQVLTECDVTSVEEKDGRLISVTIKGAADSRTIPCDVLIAAKGVSPNMGLIADTDIATNWGIVTNSKMQTNIENIYAAGDVAETFDIAIEQHTVNALWTCAIQQGRAAGYNMAGIDREYDGSVGMNSINFPGVDLISFGVIRTKPDDGYEVLVENRPHQGVYKKAVLKDDKVKGLVLVNAIDNAGVLLSLLGRKIDISDVKHEILNDGFNYAKLMANRGPDEFERYWKASQIRT